MEAKVWLKKELKGETCGSITAMFETTIALLKARIAWLKKEKSPAERPANGATPILEAAMDDIKRWCNELQLTEDDEV